MQTQTPMFQTSMEARQAADYLIKKANTGNREAIITYEELSKAAGCDVRLKSNVLQTARNIVLRECNEWFVTIRGLGLKLATSQEASGEGENSRNRMKRIATKGMRRMGAVKYDDLSEEEKVTHNMNASLLGAFRIMTNQSSRKRLEGAVSQAEDRISATETFRLFHVRGGNGETSQS